MTEAHIGGAALRGHYKAIFFDLDGTLLPMELDTFMGHYLDSLSAYMKELGIDPKQGLAALGAGVKRMMANDGSATNCELFWDTFSSMVDADAQQKIAPYYETEFGKIGRFAEPNPDCAAAVETLRSKGYRLALTTMPMFPRRAVEWRLEWAGVDKDAFEIITTYENSRSAKPHAAYYQNVIHEMGLRGEDVLMVGNNTLEDGGAVKAGCDLFIVTDHLIDPEGGVDLHATAHGTMADFLSWCKALPRA